MAEDQRMLTELDEQGVLLVTMNRPERKNAFDEIQWDALNDTLAEAEKDPRVAVVVLTGAGGNFSSGADLGGMSGESPPPREDGFPSAFFAAEARLLAFPKTDADGGHGGRRGRRLYNRDRLGHCVRR